MNKYDLTNRIGLPKVFGDFFLYIFLFSRFMTIDRHNKSRSVVNLNQNVQDLEGEGKITSLLEHTALWPVLGMFVPLLYECKNQSK